MDLNTIKDVSQTPPFPEFSNPLLIKDTKGKTIGAIGALNNTDGKASMMLIISGNLKNNNNWDSIRLSINSDGTVETQAPAPIETSNTNNIATTKWVRTYVNKKIYSTASGIDVTSAWSTGEWTNNLNDGYLLITLGPTKDQQVWTLYDSQVHIIAHFGSVSGDSSTVVYPVFVKKGLSYSLKMRKTTGYSQRAGIQTGTSTAPEWAVFYALTTN